MAKTTPAAPHTTRKLYIFSTCLQKPQKVSGADPGTAMPFFTPENCTSMRVRASSYSTMESPCCDTKCSQYLGKDRDGCPEDRDCLVNMFSKIEPNSRTFVNISRTFNDCQYEQDSGTTAGPLRFSIGGQAQREELPGVSELLSSSSGLACEDH